MFDFFKQPVHPITLALILAGLMPATARTETTITVPVQFDRWMYPFNATPGGRVTGSTFGAVGETAFDDLDAQILLGFPTLEMAPLTLVTDPNFQLLSATIHLTTATDRAIVLDETMDERSTYLDPTADRDPGRPMMLFGVGTRGGYTDLGLGVGEVGAPIFNEPGAFGRPGPPASQIRYAFASDDGTRDVSNFVRDQLSIQPWAIGRANTVAAGSELPVNTTLDFQIDLQNSAARQQLLGDLQNGAVFASVTSLHSATAGSNVGVPTFYLGDLNQNQTGPRATLSLSYQVIPEPSTGALLALAMLGLLRQNLKRKRKA